jgi:class 3 adenylate cyclase
MTGSRPRDRFLELFPELAQHPPAPGDLDAYRVYELDRPVDRVRPVFTDTSALNRSLGLPEMTFEERDGRLFGRAIYGGLLTEWEEVPWQWEYRRRLHTARVYSRGVARLVHVCFLLEAIDDGAGTRFSVYFCWRPRGIVTRVMLWWGTRRLLARYGDAVNDLVLASDTEPSDRRIEAAARPDPGAPISQALELRDGLVRTGHDEHLVDRLLQYVTSAPDDELYRLRVRVLARQWGAELSDLLHLCLQATRAGVLTLTWDVICPHCRGVRNEISHLGDLPEVGRCDVCDIDFETQALDALEVTFHVHPSIRVVAPRFYCSAEPATKSHIKMALTLRAGETRRLETLLDAGRYRLRVRGSKSYTSCDLEQGAGPRELRWDGERQEGGLQAEAAPLLLLTNPAQRARTFLVEEDAVDRDVLRPAELFRFQAFRDLFAEEALATGVHLNVGEQTILFTDIVGSSQLYRDRGDPGAFAQVRRHFTETYRLVEAHDGAVAKTIGDAAMAAFARPVDGLRAAVSLQRRFADGPEDLGVRIRATLHVGACLAVNLNSGIDYFGDTVNLCAKVQRVAGAGEVVVTQEVMNDAGVSSYLAEEDLQPQRRPFTQPWDGGSLDVWGIPVHAPSVSHD